MQPPHRALIALAAIAMVEGAALIGYAGFDAIEGLRIGTPGPDEVSSPPALLLLIAITAAFGAGLALVASGWWRARRWARAPFVLAQLIIGLVGFELAQSQGTVQAVGSACMVLAATGLVLSFVPGVSRAIDEPEA